MPFYLLVLKNNLGSKLLQASIRGCISIDPNRGVYFLISSNFFENWLNLNYRNKGYNIYII